MSCHFAIREFGVPDREAVLLILREAWARTYAGLGVLASMYALLEDDSLAFLLPRAGETALMAFVDEAPGGLLVTRQVRGVDCLLALYVRPGFQRRGLGKALLRHAASKRPTLTLLETQVIEESPGAVAFYRALGFEEVGRRRVALSSARTAGVIVMQASRVKLLSAP